MSVDLPAPLSPTSAITSPSRTAKSTSFSAWTEPKLFETPRSSSVSRRSLSTGRFYHGRGRARRAPSTGNLLLAVLRVLADADLASLQEALLEEELVVALRDPDGRQQDRFRAADVAVDAGDLAALDEGNRGGRGRVRLLADRLVDGSALPAGEDELDAGRRRILPRQRDRLEPVGLQRRDDRARKSVVGGDRGVDLVAVAGEDLVEDAAALDRIPVGPLVTCRRLLERAALEERVQDRVVALLEQLGVVVLDVAVQLRDDRLARVLAVRPECGDEAAALKLADTDVVERDVVRGLAPDDQAVVVDDFRLAAHGQVRNRLAGCGVELVEQDDLRALREALLGLRLLLLRVGVSIQDGGGDARLPECSLQIRRVEERVAR